MDWITWLSSSPLNPSLVQEYGLAFAHNELEHEDILYFNHDFLQSIGISVAKHRLEILKLARADLRRRPPLTRRLRRALSAARRRLTDLIRNLSRRSAVDDARKALILVPKSRFGDRKLVVPERQGRFLLTNGSPPVGGGGGLSFSGPVVCDLRREEKGDCYWGNEVEEIRWDAMFQNLKPT